MVEVSNFTKIYKLNKKQMLEQKTKAKTKIAVQNITFSAEKGQIFGLLGPNGAGKTTTMRSIATLLKPTEGQIKVNGFDTVKEGNDVRHSIGFLTNEIKMDEYFTPDYLMTFYGRLHGLDEQTIKERKANLFQHFGITEFVNKKVGELSTGMKQKLSIAVSIIHDPEVVIFDEPTNGLDIITARAVTDYLLQLKKEGKLVIVSTHIMSLAEKFCDRIAIIIGGKLVAEGTVAEVVKSNQSDDLEDAFFKLYQLHGEGN